MKPKIMDRDRLLSKSKWKEMPEFSDVDPTNWQKFALQFFCRSLAKETKFNKKFLEILRREEILTEYWFYQARMLLKTRQAKMFYCLPFATHKFYDVIVSALFETHQDKAAATFLKAGYTIGKLWEGQNPCSDSTKLCICSPSVTGWDWRLLWEAVGFHCDVTLLERFYETDDEDVKALLFRKNEHARNLLHHAVSCGHIEAIKYLILIGFDVNLKCNKGCAPLLLLGQQSSNIVPVTQVLLEQGADLYSKDGENNTVAHTLNKRVTAEQYHDWIEFILEAGHKSLLLEEGQYDYLPVEAALSRGEVSDRTLRLAARELNFTCNLATDNGVKVFLLAFTGKQSKPVLDFLFQLMGDSDLKYQTAGALLHAAVERDNLVAVQCFLSLGADPNGKNEAGKVPLDLLPPDGFNSEGIRKALVDRQEELENRTRMQKLLSTFENHKFLLSMVLLFGGCVLSFLMILCYDERYLLYST